MKTILAALLMTVSFSAFAYEDTTFSCRNPDTALPANTYKIQTLNIAGVNFPYLEVTRYFKKPDGSIQTVTARGLANHLTAGATSEKITLGYIVLEIENGTMVNCRP